MGIVACRVKKTMCSGCMKQSDTKLCIRCQTKAHKQRQARAKNRTIWQTAAWRMVREQVMHRDRYQCTQCGARPPHAVLTVHHHHYDTPLDGTSMVTLCRQCHGKQHGGKHTQHAARATTKHNVTPTRPQGGSST